MIENDDYHILRSALAGWSRRRRLRDALIWLPRTALAGLLVAVLIAAGARLLPLLESDELATIVLALGAAGLLIGIILVGARRFTTMQKARFADRQFGLMERAATAVELQAGNVAAPPALVAQQLSDTLLAVKGVDVRAGMPLHLAWRDWLVLAVALVLLVAAIQLPNPQAEILKHRRAVAETITEQIVALEALSEEIVKNPALSAEQKEALQEPISGALEALQENDLSQAEAMAVLSEAEADLRALGENGAAELLNNLRTAGQPLAANANAGVLGEALQNGNLAAAGAAAAQLADSLPNLTASEREALAQDLTATGEALANIDSELAQQLIDAAEALQNGDLAEAQQALRQAGATLQGKAQQAAGAQQAVSAAEALQTGQEQIAQADQSAPEGGQVSGQAPAQGAGLGQAPGQGSDAGDGSEGGLGGGQGGTGGESGHTENVFVPDFRDLSDTAGVEIELPAECVANPESCGGLLNENPAAIGDERSLVPYEQVFGDYRDAAYEALSEEYIPLGLKGFIRDYFASLEP